MKNDIFVDILLFEMKLEDKNTIHLVYDIIIKLINIKSLNIIDNFFCNKGI